MRGTLFILPIDLLEIAWAATRDLVAGPSAKYLAQQGVSPPAYRRWSASITRLLEGRALPATVIRAELRAGSDIAIPAILNQMCDDGQLLRDQPAAGWRDAHHTYRLLEECLPDVDLDRYGRDQAAALLVERYVARYGPVSVPDIGWWTGLGARRIRAALQRLGDAVVETDVPGWAGRHLVHAADLERLADAAGLEHAQVSVLPLLDPLTMGYRDRARLIRPDHRDLVYDGSGNATNTVLINGEVGGVWDLVGTHDELRYHAFAPWPPSIQQRVEQLLEATAAFMVGRPVRLRRIDRMIPLTRQRRGWMKKPLHAT
jgi:hypothetical protein